MHKRLVLTTLLVVVVSIGALILRSQQQNQTREKKPPRPGTIRALVEKAPNDQVSLGKEIDYPTFESVDALFDSSDVVIRGRIVGSRSVMCDRMEFVCTQFRVKVLEVFWGTIPDDRRGIDRIPTLNDRATGKRATPATPRENRIAEFEGPGRDEIVVTQAGGNLGVNGKSVRAWVADQETLQNGHDYMLFLKWIPESRETTLGRNTYVLTGGPQGGVKLEGGKMRSMVPAYRHDHPIRFELESLLKGDLGLTRSHLEERRQGRRP